MKAPAFWWRRPVVFTRDWWLWIAARPVGMIYGAITARRMAEAGTKLSVPVICIGNFVAGGAGKTPVALRIAEILIAAGRNPVFLSRGYGAKANGPLRVDRESHTAADVGDEPLLLARMAPVIVGADRTATARLAIAAGADCLIMDDGFQNPAVEKDLSLVVVDARRGIGTGLCVPADPMRAPLRHQLRHADAIVVVGAEDMARPVVRAAFRSGIPVFSALLAPRIPPAIRSGRVLAFAGIGDPEKFFDTLRGAGVDVTKCRSFADHHPYTEADADGLIADAEADGLMLATTEKDFVRLSGASGKACGRLAAAVTAVPARLDFREPHRVEHLLDNLLAAGANAV